LDGERIIDSGVIKDFRRNGIFLGTSQGENFIKKFHESDEYKEISRQIEETFNIKTTNN
jgi:hypothetical protein